MFIYIAEVTHQLVTLSKKLIIRLIFSPCVNSVQGVQFYLYSTESHITMPRWALQCQNEYAALCLYTLDLTEEKWPSKAQNIQITVTTLLLHVDYY